MQTSYHSLLRKTTATTGTLQLSPLRATQFFSIANPSCLRCGPTTTRVAMGILAPGSWLTSHTHTHTNKKPILITTTSPQHFTCPSTASWHNLHTELQSILRVVYTNASGPRVRNVHTTNTRPCNIHHWTHRY